MQSEIWLHVANMKGNFMNEKDKFIKMISTASDMYGSLLLEMMDKYGANSLQELTEEQVKEFYEERILKDE